MFPQPSRPAPPATRAAPAPQPAQARPLIERALAITEAAYGPDHPTVATDLNNLAFRQTIRSDN